MQYKAVIYGVSMGVEVVDDIKTYDSLDEAAEEVKFMIEMLPEGNSIKIEISPLED